MVPRPEITVIITAHNEGAEVEHTLQSVRASTEARFEIILVDDGSTDGSTSDLSGGDLRLIRHADRIGVAFSRHAAARKARGEVLAFLDAHQRLSHGCLDRCAAVACEYSAIVWPDVQGLTYHGWTGHGAQLELSASSGQFEAQWLCERPATDVTPITAMITPGYVMPRGIYPRLQWSGLLRGWGASEPALTIKAFFLGIPLLHLCGPIAYHLFRKEFPYGTDRRAVVRNHAIVARLCFSEATWRSYWLPEVFQRQLAPAVLTQFDSPEMLGAQRAFARQKLRPDADFWRSCLRTPVPDGVLTMHEVADSCACIAKAPSHLDTALNWHC